ncbi:MAG: hypothetical protein CM15mV61_070 [uncultured marine virus]|nr:MAG: hypothetical protein CM15mV61_070 [uncultured marine virus]
MADSLYEILEPFASESIYTEALLDSTVRRGLEEVVEECGHLKMTLV